jgi:uncharacterized protein
MAAFGSKAAPRRVGQTSSRMVRRVGVAAAVSAVIVPLMGCDLMHEAARRAGGFCPRPAVAVANTAPQFNQQASEIHNLRRHAFRNDFFAQLELARRYEGSRTTDKNLEDLVESATWYAIALTNPTGYDSIAGQAERGGGARVRAAAQYDDCRAFERRDAYFHLNILLTRMSSEERDKVRKRTVYMLSTLGADGFRTLARLHDAAFGPLGEPIDNPQARWALGKPDHPGVPAVLSLFERNDVDAYLYNYLAAQTGDVGAFVMMKESEKALREYERGDPARGGFANLVESKANRWTPPYEFYPPESPESGVPHSDESEPNSDAAESALGRVYQLPFTHIAQALAFLHMADKPTGHEESVGRNAILALQAALGREQTGELSPIERVRAIQLAAVDGSARAQLVLAVMYSEGVGVPVDYARAYHWYETADKQGSPEAKYAMSTFFSLGVEGVADQDKAKAVVYQIDSALSGFKPSAERLAGILARVSRPQHRTPGGYSW